MVGVERRPMFINVAILLLVVGSLVSSKGLTDHKGRIYHGKIKENSVEGDAVELDVPLSVKNPSKFSGAEICGYTIFNNGHTEQPFKIELIDQSTGEARLVLNTGHHLDYEQKKKYKLTISGYDCLTGTHADREVVHITVEDVNEFSPVWEEASYTGTIEENTINEQILRVKATDADGSEVFSKVCQYHVLTADVPFEIDDNGYLRNTRPLQYDETSEYNVEVKAEDCGGRVSERILIDIKVKEKCKSGWAGFEDRIEVLGPMMKQPLMPRASLDLCDIGCEPERITAEIRLDTSHVGKGCDRDLFSLRDRRKICGGSAGSIDLLPSTAWMTSALTSTEESDHSDDSVHTFDGVTTSVEVPVDEVDAIVGRRFTLSTWMKHDRNEQETEPDSHKTKEYIVCSSDGDGMNRPHFGLFIHNCRLVLLLRREPGDGESAQIETSDILEPAEWRWTLPEVCDGKWHHYDITVDLPQVNLFVDGRRFVASKNNPEILDDFPLRTVADVHFTRLSIGACWQGGKHVMSHYFNGQLSTLSLLKNETDSEDMLQCLNSCQERLDLAELDDSDTGASLSMNADMNWMTIVGLSAGVVEKLIHSVSYVNNRVYPTPGTRSLTLRTHIQCVDSKEDPSISDINLALVVRETKEVMITLTGSTIRSAEEEELMRGKYIFNDLIIDAEIKTKGDDADEEGNVSEPEKTLSEVDFSLGYLVESCSVDVEPPISADVDRFLLPLGALKEYGLEVASTDNGFIIAGLDKMTSYQHLLRQVRYISTQPQRLRRREFLLHCSEINRHVVSKPLKVNLDVVRKASSVKSHHSLMLSDKSSHDVMSDNKRLIDKSLSPSGAKYDAEQTGVGVAVVMIVCIGFVLMLIVLGIVRSRNNQHDGVDDQDEDREKGELNQSGLTITVNPMDPDNVYEEEDAVHHDDDCNCTDSDDDDDEEVMYRDERLQAAHTDGQCPRHGRQL